MSKPFDHVSIGRLSKPHGLGGEMEVVPLTDFPERFKPGAKFMLHPPSPDFGEIIIESKRDKNKKILVKFAGVNDRTRAEELCGRDLIISADELIDLPTDVYWYHDLIGLRVVTDEGRELGEIKEIMSGPANDIYVVGDDREYLIPAIAQVIMDIDLKSKTMKIKPLPGLLD